MWLNQLNPKLHGGFLHWRCLPNPLSSILTKAQSYRYVQSGPVRAWTNDDKQSGLTTLPRCSTHSLSPAGIDKGYKGYQWIPKYK